MAGKLEAAVERELSRPAVWGESDCCLAVANVLREMHGVDVAAEFRGKYRDRAGAYRLMGPGGVMATARRITEALGWPEIEPAEAQDGDVGVRGPSLAIHCRVWIAKGERGAFILDRVTKAWRPTCG